MEKVRPIEQITYYPYIKRLPLLNNARYQKCIVATPFHWYELSLFFTSLVLPYKINPYVENNHQ